VTGASFSNNVASNTRSPIAISHFLGKLSTALRDEFSVNIAIAGDVLLKLTMNVEARL
jgi:hypothetical protein